MLAFSDSPALGVACPCPVRHASAPPEAARSRAGSGRDSPGIPRTQPVSAAECIVCPAALSASARKILPKSVAALVPEGLPQLSCCSLGCASVLQGARLKQDRARAVVTNVVQWATSLLKTDVRVGQHVRVHNNTGNGFNVSAGPLGDFANGGLVTALRRTQDKTEVFVKPLVGAVGKWMLASAVSKQLLDAPTESTAAPAAEAEVAELRACLDAQTERAGKATTAAQAASKASRLAQKATADVAGARDVAVTRRDVAVARLTHYHSKDSVEVAAAVAAKDEALIAKDDALGQKRAAETELEGARVAQRQRLAEKQRQVADARKEMNDAQARLHRLEAEASQLAGAVVVVADLGFMYDVRLHARYTAHPHARRTARHDVSGFTKHFHGAANRSFSRMRSNRCPACDHQSRRPTRTTMQSWRETKHAQMPPRRRRSSGRCRSS